MAKGKSSKIKVFTDKDKALVNMLNKTGCCTANQAYKLNETNQARLDKLTKSGILDKECSKYGNIFSLTDKGKRFADSSTGSYHRAGTNHDLNLTNEYIKIEPNLRDSIQTGDHYARSRNLVVKGTPDLVITTELQREIFIEIVTDSYGREQIEEKETFAEVCKAELRIIEATEEE